MKLEKLHELEGRFFSQYPNGFEDEGLKEISKRHNVDKLTAFTKEALKKDKFNDFQHIIDSLTKIVSRSSMISLFDKPKFRDGMIALSIEDKQSITRLVKILLYSRSQRKIEKSFNEYIELLASIKLARWTLGSVIQYYHSPQKAYFIKPTTTKMIIDYFEMDDIKYQPRPTFAFYEAYSNYLNTLKENTHPDIAANNAAFTGFLMMTIK